MTVLRWSTNSRSSPAACPRAAPCPVLSGVLLQAADGRLDLYSTDMELSIKASLTTTVERDGDVVVPARLFTDVVRNLPDENDRHRRRRVGGQDPRRQRRVLAQRLVGERLPADLHLRASRAPSRSAASRSWRRSTRWAGRRRATRRGPSSPACSSPSSATRSRWSPPTATAWPSRRPSSTQALAERGAGHRAGQGSRRGRAARRRPWATASSRSRSARTRRSSARPIRAATCGSPRVSSTASSPTTSSSCPRRSITRSCSTRTLFTAAARRVSLLAQKNAPLRLAFADGKLTMRALTQDVGQAEESLRHRVRRRGLRDRLQPRVPHRGHRRGRRRQRSRLRFTSPLRPGLVSGAGEDFVYLIMPIRLSS